MAGLGMWALAGLAPATKGREHGGPWGVGTCGLGTSREKGREHGGPWSAGICGLGTSAKGREHGGPLGVYL